MKLTHLGGIMQQRKRIIIAGAAGRDFHDFNTAFRDNEEFEIVAFTAAQIPNIDGRRYPPQLAGALYPDGIPIYSESELEQLVKKMGIDEVVFAYSDVSHEHVMHIASRALSTGSDFVILGPDKTMLKSTKPVVAVCAVRTGSGKSQTSRHVAGVLKDIGFKNVVAVRHPMPYGDIARQAVQRFAVYEDLERNQCTIEEREEYEPYIDMGAVIYAGVDYQRILEQVEDEADIIIWDGGNNDLPFFKPDVHIVVADPLRAGHELRYHPGETNLRMADIVLINKIDSASYQETVLVQDSIREVNPEAVIVRGASPITVSDPLSIRGKKVVVVEDGPTLTHGEMAFGAGVVAAKYYGASEIIDPRPYAVGSIAETFQTYTTTGPVLPAMGYGEKQVSELERTINAIPADLVLIATPIDLGRLIKISVPSQRVSYSLQEIGRPTLDELLRDRLS